MIDPLESIKQYKARAAYLMSALDDTESDFASILVQTQDLLQRARKGFDSDRVNMKSPEDGVSRLNEAMPAIEVSCLQIKLKVNELLVKVLTMDETPDTNISVVVNTRNLEDVLADG